MFENELPRCAEIFDLRPDSGGVKNIITYDTIEKKIHQMCLEIKFESFCYEFKSDYIGEDDDAELMMYTIDKIREDLECIKMVYTNNLTGRIVYTSPETVFKKMNVFIELLSANATTWSFCSPWMFFAALPSELQEEMRNQGFSRPQVATLSTKKAQSKALSQFRDSAVRAYNRLQETRRQMRSLKHELDGTLCQSISIQLHRRE